MKALVIVSIIIAILATISILCGWITPIIMKVNVTTPPPPPRDENKDEEKEKKEKKSKKGWWVLAVVVALIVVGLLTWWLTRSHEQEKARVATSSRIITVQPKEEWVFSQVNQNGERSSFEVEVTKREAGLLYAVVQQIRDGTRVNVAGLRLNEIRDGQLFGTWVNYIDGDHGDMTLYKIRTNVWTGQYILEDRTSRLCTLERK